MLTILVLRVGVIGHHVLCYYDFMHPRSSWWDVLEGPSLPQGSSGVRGAARCCKARGWAGARMGERADGRADGRAGGRTCGWAGVRTDVRIGVRAETCGCNLAPLLLRGVASLESLVASGLERLAAYPATAFAVP